MSDARVEEFLLFIKYLTENIRNSKDILESSYSIISQYGLPNNTGVDQDFIYNCLISYYELDEQYEKCNILLQLKRKERPVKPIDDSVTYEEWKTLKRLGFQIPDSVTMKVML